MPTDVIGRCAGERLVVRMGGDVLLEVSVERVDGVMAHLAVSFPEAVAVLRGEADDLRHPREPEDRRVLTNGMVARMFGVAPRTAAKWMDGGLIAHWRVAGSRDRRAFLRDALEFARRTGTPVVVSRPWGDRTKEAEEE